MLKTVFLSEGGKEEDRTETLMPARPATQAPALTGNRTSGLWLRRPGRGLSFQDSNRGQGLSPAVTTRSRSGCT